MVSESVIAGQVMYSREQSNRHAIWTNAIVRLLHHPPELEPGRWTSR
jgi:hypothetical protein